MKTSLLILLFWAVTAHNVLLGQTPGASGGLVTNIPIHNVSGNGVDIPVRLDWVAPNGIRPDEHPGWVGNGFTLQAGGSVQRVVRGYSADEFWVKDVLLNCDIDYPLEDYGVYTSNIGYLYNAYTLDRVSSDSRVGDVINVQRRLVEGNLPAIVLSAALNSLLGLVDLHVNVIGSSDVEHVKPIDMEADLFTFNCNGVAGTFLIAPETYMVGSPNSPDGSINIIKGLRCIEDPTIQIELSTIDVSTNVFRYRPTTNLVTRASVSEVAGGSFTVTKRVITGVKIIMGDGRVFTFGSFETSMFNEDDPKFEIGHNFFNQTRFFSPTTEWFLNDIKDHNSNVLAEFEYEKDKFTIDYNEAIDIYRYRHDGNLVQPARGGGMYGKFKQATYRHKSYLKKITTTIEEVLFERGASTQLEMDYTKLAKTWPVIEPYGINWIGNLSYNISLSGGSMHVSEFDAASNLADFPYTYGDFTSSDASQVGNGRFPLCIEHINVSSPIDVGLIGLVSYYNGGLSVATAASRGFTGTPSLQLSHEVIDVNRIKWMQLNRIVVRNKSSNNVIGSYDLSYVNAPNERLRLGSVVAKGAQNGAMPPVELEYERPAPEPPYTYESNDYWGFYNGSETYLCSAESGRLFNIGNTRYTDKQIQVQLLRRSDACGAPGLDNTEKGFSNILTNIYTDTDYEILSRDLYVARRPVFEKAKLGMLKKIKFSNGATKEFEYEPNIIQGVVVQDANPNSPNGATQGRVRVVDYLSRDHVPLIAPYYYPANMLLGTDRHGPGVRLSSVIVEDGSNESKIRKNFYYTNGVLNGPVRFLQNDYRMKVHSQGDEVMDKLNTGYSPYSKLTYSAVEEATVGIEGGVKSYYTDYNTNPDEGFKATMNPRIGNYAPVSSKSSERGLLKTRDVLDGSGMVLERTQYIYQRLSLPRREKIKSIVGGLSIWTVPQTQSAAWISPIRSGWEMSGYLYETFTNPMKLQSVKVSLRSCCGGQKSGVVSTGTPKSDSDGGNQKLIPGDGEPPLPNDCYWVSQVTRYDYNEYGLLAFESSQQSDGLIKTIGYSYTGDFISPLYPNLDYQNCQTAYDDCISQPNADFNVCNSQYISCNDAVTNAFDAAVANWRYQNGLFSRLNILNWPTETRIDNGTGMLGGRITYSDVWPGQTGKLYPRSTEVLLNGAWKETMRIEDYDHFSSKPKKVSALESDGVTLGLPKEINWLNGLALNVAYQGRMAEMEYDHNNSRRLTRFRSPNTLESNFEYDEFGRLKSSSSRGGVIESENYYSVGAGINWEFSSVNIQGAGSYSSANLFDDFGRLDRSVALNSAGGNDFSDRSVSQRHDVAGRVISSCDEQTGKCTTLTRENNPLGRVLMSLPDSDGKGITYEYGTNCVELEGYSPLKLYKIVVTNQNGDVAESYFDFSEKMVLNRKYLDITNNLYTQTRYFYNLRNQVTRAVVTSTVPNTPVLTYTYEYDDWGRLTSSTSPDAGTKSYTYDSKHRLESETDAVGQRINYEYNSFDQLEKVRLNGALIKEYIYNPNSGVSLGLLQRSRVKVMDNSGTWLENTYGYDQWGRLRSINGNNHLGGSDDIVLTRNNQDQVTHMERSHAAFGKTTLINGRNEYDYLGRLKNEYFWMNNNPEQLIAGYDYDRVGRPVGLNLGYTQRFDRWLQQLDYGFDKMDRLEKINNPLGGNEKIPTCSDQTVPAENLPLPEIDVNACVEYLDNQSFSIDYNVYELRRTDKEATVRVTYSALAHLANGLVQNVSKSFLIRRNHDGQFDNIQPSPLGNWTVVINIAAYQTNAQNFTSMVSNDIPTEVENLFANMQIFFPGQWQTNELNPEVYKWIGQRLGAKMAREYTELFKCETNDDDDLFYLSLQRENPVRPLNASPRLDGSISSVVWQVGKREQQVYGYSYDGMGRLTGAKYADVTFDDGIPLLRTDNKFGENATYDGVGNILSMTRRGMLPPNLINPTQCNGYGLIDKLDYGYNSSTNNLLGKISESADRTLGFKFDVTIGGNIATYAYDANGNLITDTGKGILSITYNYLNQPTYITFASGYAIGYLYDSDGNKLRKTMYNSVGRILEKRDYLGGIEYKDNTMEFVAHSHGRAIIDDKKPEQYRLEYAINDHTGMTRITFRDIDEDGSVSPKEITQERHTYPFGAPIADENFISKRYMVLGPQPLDNYGYTGKEWQTDLGIDWYDFGARQYDPWMGRWASPDPMADVPHQIAHSAYQNCLNDPVNLSDPSGMIAFGWDGITPGKGSADGITPGKASVDGVASGTGSIDGITPGKTDVASLNPGGAAAGEGMPAGAEMLIITLVVNTLTNVLEACNNPGATNNGPGYGNSQPTVQSSQNSTSSDGNLETAGDGGDGGNDFVKDAKGNIRWDRNANSPATTSSGDVYLGKTLVFEFNSYIDSKYFDFPSYKSLFLDASGDKLTSNITISAIEDANGDVVTLLSPKPLVVLGPTPVGTPRNYYPGGGENKFETSFQNNGGFKLYFEQHASVNSVEEIGMNMWGYNIVNVAQKLEILFSNNFLFVNSYTDIFPSATLKVNGFQLMYYKQPSFINTHKLKVLGYSNPTYPGAFGSPLYDTYFKPSWTRR